MSDKIYDKERTIFVRVDVEHLSLQWTVTRKDGETYRDSALGGSSGGGYSLQYIQRVDEGLEKLVCDIKARRAIECSGIQFVYGDSPTWSHSVETKKAWDILAQQGFFRDDPKTATYVLDKIKTYWGDEDGLY